jgi:hypothetical protein
MNATLRSLSLGFALSLAAPAPGALPEVDAFAAARRARRALARSAEDVARPGTLVHVEERLGVPTFLQPARSGGRGRAALA